MSLYSTYEVKDFSLSDFVPFCLGKYLNSMSHYSNRIVQYKNIMLEDYKHYIFIENIYANYEDLMLIEDFYDGFIHLYENSYKQTISEFITSKFINCKGQNIRNILTIVDKITNDMRKFYNKWKLYYDSDKIYYRYINNAIIYDFQYYMQDQYSMDNSEGDLPMTILFRYADKSESEFDNNRPIIKFRLVDFINSCELSGEFQDIVENLRKIYIDNNIDIDKQEIQFTPIKYKLRSKGKNIIKIERYLGNTLGRGGNIAGFFIYNQDKNIQWDFPKLNNFRLGNVLSCNEVLKLKYSDQYNKDYIGYENKIYGNNYTKCVCGSSCGLIHELRDFLLWGVKMINNDQIPDFRMISNPQKQIHHLYVGLNSTINFDSDVIKVFKAGALMDFSGFTQINQQTKGYDWEKHQNLIDRYGSNLSNHNEVNVVGECDFLGYKLDILQTEVLDNQMLIGKHYVQYKHTPYGRYEVTTDFSGNKLIKNYLSTRTEIQDTIFTQIRKLVLEILPYSNLFALNRGDLSV